MNPYKTIKDCAVDIICREGDKLSNKEIANKVREIMKSDTSHKCIAWYKNKINRGIIKINKNKCNWLKKSNEIHKEITFENLDEVNFENEAERHIYNIEKKRTGKFPQKIKTTSKGSVGYDFDSGERHIEVKCKRKENASWLQLTSKETEVLIKDSKYWIYLVEGDFENNPDNVKLYMIPQKDLLSMSQLKIHIRLTQLSNKGKRRQWLYKSHK